MDNRPRGRQKNITGTGKGVYKRGSGLGTGPVGSSGGYSGRGGQQNTSRPQSSQGSQGSQRSNTARASGKRSPLLIIIIIIVAVIAIGGGGISGLFGGSSGDTAPVTPSQSSTQQSNTQQEIGGFANLFSSTSFSGGTVSTGWDSTANLGKLDTSVTAGSRAKYTKLAGGGRDEVLIMVYMCGTDLESKSGMATADLSEMASADIGDNVTVVVYTGGCTKWKNNIVSSGVNQIYQVVGGGLRCLEDDMGTDSMTNPKTLAAFIDWCFVNYPDATRNELIFWDHGGGSLSGYGYDEKNPRSGSMTLSAIDSALKGYETRFDFIGFDACLMATLENALMLSPYADYLIASEETEPGVGWYYTNWLKKLSENTSMATVEIGKNIIDDFVDVCAQKCNGQKTTLSVIDLAELTNTVPDAFRLFAADTSELLTNNEYQTVSDARRGAREFATSSKIDQVDLVHLARNMGTDEGNALADALLGAVKYNRTSSDMTNAYGVSIYFPYQKTSNVDSAVKTYEAIGLADDYSRCIQQFASLELGGQTASASTSSPLSSLLGTYQASSPVSSDAVMELFGTLLGGSDFFGRSLDMESAAQYISENQFDATALVWSVAGDGMRVLRLSEQQWSMINDIELNVFVDDGEGFIDLGLDNVFDFTEDGALIGEYDGTWLAINEQPVAYYHLDTVDDGVNLTITGRVPVLLNGTRADLILVFDNDNPLGYIAGARFDYRDGETDTVAKSLTELNVGDTIDFLCDYYSYSGEYIDSYLLGEQLVYDGNEFISNVYIDASSASAVYRLTDMYCGYYWTPEMTRYGN